jgi:RNA-directed DNA polymerase
LQASTALEDQHRGETMSQLLLFEEDPATSGLFIIEEMVRPGNLLKAYRRVKRNKGVPGVDGMTVDELGDYLRSAWQAIREQVLTGDYRPQPVKRAKVRKQDGGWRNLGVPTGIDRLLQQALLQVLTPIFDPWFSDGSFGFRPGRGTHGAVLKAKDHVAAGYRWVVDLDLEKFFDRVNHDVLMALVARKVKDKRALRLIRRFLQAGILENGLVSPSLEGTPQGGPLSPLLSNILLDELDKELERRGHRFCRYADDCNVYVRSRRAGMRLKASLTRFLVKRLRLRVNEQKSAVDRPWRRQFLGYSMTTHREPRLMVAPDREKRLKRGLRPLMRAGRGRSIPQTLTRLAPKIRGWVGYFRLCDVKAAFERLDRWARRRIRALMWRHWKRPKTRYKRLRKLGLNAERARKSAYNGFGPWWNAGSSPMNRAVSTRTLQSLGLVSFFEEFQRLKRSAG